MIILVSDVKKEWRQKDFIWPSSLLKTSEKDSEVGEHCEKRGAQDMDDVLDALATESLSPKEDSIETLRVGAGHVARGVFLQVFKAVVSLKFTSAVQRPLGNFEKEFGRQATRKAVEWIRQVEEEG